MGLTGTTALNFALVRDPVEQVFDDCMFLQKQGKQFYHAIRAIDDWHKSFHPEFDVHC